MVRMPLSTAKERRRQSMLASFFSRSFVSFYRHIDDGADLYSALLHHATTS